MTWLCPAPVIFPTETLFTFFHTLCCRRAGQKGHLVLLLNRTLLCVCLCFYAVGLRSLPQCDREWRLQQVEALQWRSLTSMWLSKKQQVTLAVLSCLMLSSFNNSTTTGHVKDGQAANRRSRKQAASYIYFFFFLHWLSQTVLRWFAFPLPVLLWWVEPRRTPDGPASPPSGQRCRLVTFVTSNLTLPFVFEFLISASFLLFHHDRFQLFPVPCFFTAGENISWCLPQKLLYN